MKLKITKTFPFAHGGRNVVTYEKGQVIDTDDKELIAVALEEGWATKTKAGTSDESPENKADTPALETKATDQ
jgi:hypothetical protein